MLASRRLGLPVLSRSLRSRTRTGHELTRRRRLVSKQSGESPIRPRLMARETPLVLLFFHLCFFPGKGITMSPWWLLLSLAGLIYLIWSAYREPRY